MPNPTLRMRPAKAWSPVACQPLCIEVPTALHVHVVPVHCRCRWCHCRRRVQMRARCCGGCMRAISSPNQHLSAPLQIRPFLVCFSLELLCGCYWPAAWWWVAQPHTTRMQNAPQPHDTLARGCPHPCTGCKVIRELLPTCVECAASPQGQGRLEHEIWWYCRRSVMRVCVSVCGGGGRFGRPAKLKVL